MPSGFINYEGFILFGKDMFTLMNTEQVKKSKSVLGQDIVEMLLQVNKDALWILENLGVGCKQPEIQKAFQRFEADGTAIVYDNRIHITSGLVEKCLDKVPGLDDFFVPLNSFFIIPSPLVRMLKNELNLMKNLFLKPESLNLSPRTSNLLPRTLLQTPCS